jgi:CBS domain-containing protein
MKIQTILTTKGSNVISVRPDQTIREAIALLAKHNIGALVVVDAAGNLRGIVSERDVVREAFSNENLYSDPVGNIMTKNLITGVLQDDLESVADTMTERRIRHLPVMDQGQLVGIISIGDMVKAQRDEYAGAVHTLQAQILAEHD